MRTFEFCDYFYDAVKDLTREQKGQFLDVLCEWSFGDGTKKFDDIDEVVKAISRMALKQIPKAKLDFEQVKALSREVLEYCKDNDLMIMVKAGLSDEKKEEICKELNHIPKDIVLKQLEWIRTTYKENFYFA